MPWVKPESLHRLMNVAAGRTTLLGIDYGTRRIGLAITDPHWSFAFPVSVIQADRPIALVKKDIVDVAMEADVGGVVVGWPKVLRTDTEGLQCRRVGQFMHELNLDMFPKALWNEAYTTELVKLQMQDEFEERVASLKRKRRRLKNPLKQKGTTFDAEAAAELLRQFLEAHGKRGRETVPQFVIDQFPEGFDMDPEADFDVDYGEPERF